MEYGFIYLWYDRKHKRYYVGSHWGSEDDGYDCSSRWMRASKKRRPQDFKRRIIKKIYTNRADLLHEEYRYLAMIKSEEKKIRYYNINTTWKHWHDDPNKARNTIEKITATLREKRLNDPKYRLHYSEMGKLPWITDGIKNKKLKKGMAMPENWRYGRTQDSSHLSSIPFTEERRQKISQNHASKKEGFSHPFKDKHHSEETKEKIRRTNLGKIHSEETKEKMRKSHSLRTKKDN